MDQLDPLSPVFADKQMERDLYLEQWSKYLKPAARVLDVGGGVGRFAQWLLAQDCTVELVDPDLRSLWTAVDRLSGGRGALDVHWSTATALGDIAPVDCALAVELLCYVADPVAVLEAIRKTLRPGGRLLLSVEATSGAGDAQGVVHVPGDRWVQTYSEASLRALLSDWEILDLQPSHYVLSGPLQAQAEGLDFEGIAALEQQAKADPQMRASHRAWMAVVE
jgi:SAM-dependent methyltransferase